MESQTQSKSNLKRQCEDDNDKTEERKIARLSAPAEPMVPTEITDLNDDCLVKVFSYLDLQSLFNVAIANEWLRPAAADVYKRRFGEKWVVLFPCDKFRSNRDKTQLLIHGCDGFRLNIRGKRRISTTDFFKASAFAKWDNAIILRGFKVCLVYLRCFGPSIGGIWLDSNELTNNRYQHVQHYINDYCTASLTNIAFDLMPNIKINGLQKTFERVEHLEIYNSVLEEQGQSLFECFPNLRVLHLYHVCMDCRIVKTPLEHLKHLDIRGVRCCLSTTNQIVAALLNGNRQLEKLKMIVHDVDDDEPKKRIEPVLDAIKDKPSITNLLVCVAMTTPINLDTIWRIASEHPVLVTLDLRSFVFKIDDVLAVIGRLNLLRTFWFRVQSSEFARLMLQLEHNTNEWKATGKRSSQGNYTTVNCYNETQN